MLNTKILNILRALNHAGHEAWLVGGCVRDSLINVQFNDYDLATSARPNEVASILNDYRLDLTFKKYGCVKVFFDAGNVEITTFRKDIEHYGRGAEVVFTKNIEADAARRDFTINAIYWDGAENFQDFFDGRNNLEKGIVKFIGDPKLRTQEDYLRILRFFRFSSHYAKNIDEDGLKATIKYQEGLRYISSKHLFKEWIKLIKGKNAGVVLQTMQEHGIIRTIFGCDINLSNFEAFKSLNDLLATRLLLQDLMINFLAHRLGLNNKQIELLQLADSIKENTNFKKIYYEHKQIAKELVYFWGSKFNKDTKKILNENYWGNNNLKFPLSGSDVIKLGCNPGPNIGEYLRLTRDWWIDNDFTPGYGECLEYVKIYAISINETNSC